MLALGLSLCLAACLWHGCPPAHPADEAPPVLMAPAAAAPPKFQAGLPADFLKVSRVAEARYPAPFRVAGAVDRRKSAFLWQAVLQVETHNKPRGQHYPPGPQQIGDCVSFGWATAIYYTLANAFMSGNAGGIDDPFQPFQYGVTRVTVGGGRPGCRSDGAYPDDCAEGFKTRGWLTYREAKQPYSGALARKLGCNGPPAEWLQLAKARAGGDCYPIRTVDELIEALQNGYSGTAGFTWSPGGTLSEQGRIITLFDGWDQGGHQVAFVGWDGERQQCVFHNSHGSAAHPANSDDPPGSFRVSLPTLEWMLQGGTFWAFSSVLGFPAQEIDFSPLRPQRLAP